MIRVIGQLIKFPRTIAPHVRRGITTPTSTSDSTTPNSNKFFIACSSIYAGGVLYILAGHLIEHIEEKKILAPYREAVEISPENIRSQIDLGVKSFELARWHESKTAFERAEKLSQQQNIPTPIWLESKIKETSKHAAWKDTCDWLIVMGSK